MNWFRVWFPDPKTEIAGRLFSYFEIRTVLCLGVLVIVFYFLVTLFYREIFVGGGLDRFVYKHELLEIIWTIVPCLILGTLGFTSMENLYLMEVGDGVEYTVKVTAHQWYWDYQYELDLSKGLPTLEMENFARKMLFDNLLLIYDRRVFRYLRGQWILTTSSYTTPEIEMSGGEIGFKLGLRNQDVRCPCLLPHRIKSEILICTDDVIHRWGITRMGIKLDAVPGRINAAGVEAVVGGYGFGSCSEFCGDEHSKIAATTIIVGIDCVNFILKTIVVERDITDLISWRRIYPCSEYLNINKDSDILGECESCEGVCTPASDESAVCY